ncbi:lipoprotein-releasing ABC transporter permease subunit [Thioclava sp. BHET1]|uniref:ABC transporter substrate-binding protein n=1 Tax=Thioclava dalianensis TaxID=1185766 RepID=A0A074TPD8_9RHOB|nr:lipoprotein-releasing ABC transporter permease subunit [Thioclava dalianensis]KEP70838.1 ABC transporter substrate-binding protein [Thioclava dalianensis]TMV92659.1 lipoprotein-releasing ABC transporter permease subunit [Thioclava sp. BHET1]SFN12148.1 lipoprotein-releasing system permease protein [Thioclava dalianensis]
MAARTAPFSRFEFMIAWRYLRARRAEGGVSVMTWISLIGITLGVAALIATLAVRAGFRAEFVSTIVGSNPQITVYTAPSEVVPGSGVFTRQIRDYEERTKRIKAVPGVVSAAPAVRGQAMVSFADRANVADVYGLALSDLKNIPRIAHSSEAQGNIDNFDKGIAIGIGMARDLGVTVGDKVKLLSPNGAKTPFGTSPRVNAYTVEYIFSAGRYDIDQTRLYMPFKEAQSFFNREGGADEIDVDVADPEHVEQWETALSNASGKGTLLWTWKDASGSFLRALGIEDNVMFIILSILVLIASMNITSGLIMLVKNKGRDIGILRTMGLGQGSILRVFFLCGAFIGVIGTAAGLAIGVLFAVNIDHVMEFVNWINGGDAWDPSIRGIYHLPAKLQPWDVLKAVGLSLTLSFVVTIFPARRAARMNPVEALRYE